MSRHTAQREARRTAAPDHPSRADDAPRSPMTELAAAFMGVPWMKVWADAWTGWIQQYEASMSALQRGGADSEDRRQNAVSWMPQFESKVIPFRRSDDLPGAEATKLSMRLRVPVFPWMGGSNIIAIDTVMPRTAEPTDERFRGTEQ